MIRGLSVRGFKSLVDVEMELGRLNVVVGANGCGKTNLLEAIGLASAAVFGVVDDDVLKLRGVRLGVPSLYRSSFKPAPAVTPTSARDEGSGYSVGQAPIHLELSAGGSNYSVSLKAPSPAGNGWRFGDENFVVNGEPCAKSLPSGKGGPRGFAPALRASSPPPEIEALLETIERYRIFTPYTPMLRGTTPDPGAARPLGLMGGGLADAVGELVATEPRLGQIVSKLIDWSDALASGTAAEAQLSPAVPHTRNVLRFHDRHLVEGRDWLSAYDASEGALYVTFLAVLALHPNSPPLAAVDNVDQALNPRLAKALIEAIQAVLLANGPDEGPQLILTAHNPSVLDALDLADDRVRLFVMDRNNLGESTVRRVEHSQALALAQANGMTLSRLWLSGMLGGVPNL